MVFDLKGSRYFKISFCFKRTCFDIETPESKFQIRILGIKIPRNNCNSRNKLQMLDRIEEEEIKLQQKILAGMKNNLPNKECKNQVSRQTRQRHVLLRISCRFRRGGGAKRWPCGSHIAAESPNLSFQYVVIYPCTIFLAQQQKYIFSFLSSCDVQNCGKTRYVVSKSFKTLTHEFFLENGIIC